MSAERLAAVHAVVDKLSLEIGFPLRTSKTLNKQALQELKAQLEQLREILESEEMVPKRLVGTLWGIVTGMLTEADYAKEKKEEILTAAWEIIEALRQIFGIKY